MEIHQVTKQVIEWLSELHLDLEMTVIIFVIILL